jgi:monoamine oxidase
MKARRRLLAAAVWPTMWPALWPLAACTRRAEATYDGAWVGAAAERGHRLRDLKSGRLPEPAVTRRAGIVIVGAGISGLAAARAFNGAGRDDCHVFDLEDEAGGNSRGHVMGGMACPLGAHYLPVPGADADEVAALVTELGLARVDRGRLVYDERQLCHSPQERLFIGGTWHDGLLPPLDALPREEVAVTIAHYRRYARLVAEAGQGHAYTIPTARSAWSPALDALDRIPFAAWLDAQGLSAPALRWYLDYCCRDDYGAGARQVSAWAGLHYFASRHGFHAPGDDSDERDPLFTWPEGNAWLSRRLAAPLADRLHTGQIALRVSEGRNDVTVDFWNVAAARVERWIARQVVLAVPLFIAVRLVDAPSSALVEAARRVQHAPWLVANLQLAQPLADHPGAAPSWDNVLYEPMPGTSGYGPSLGYVDAMHQSTLPYAGATVLTAYWALGGDGPQQLAAQRARLLAEPWSVWSAAIVADLSRAHADLPSKVRRIDLMRYGHAMAIPAPGVRSSPALRALGDATGRVRFAHTDLSAYSVFEEALYQGMRLARSAA